MSTELREDEPFTRLAARPLESWRRNWVTGTAFVLVGAVLGALAGLLVPQTYTAEARVAVGAGDLVSGAISGFPLAASDLASNYARYVNDRGVASTDVPENVELSASQIPDSNVIRIEAVSSDPEAARAAANDAAKALTDAVNASGNDTADSVFKDFTAAASENAAAVSRLSAAQHDLSVLLSTPDASRNSIKQARADVTEATSEVSTTGLQSDALRQKYVNLVAEASSAAKLQLIRTADKLSSNRLSLAARLGLAGLIVLGGVGFIVVVRRDRKAATAPARTAPGPKPARGATDTTGR